MTSSPGMKPTIVIAAFDLVPDQGGGPPIVLSRSRRSYVNIVVPIERTSPDGTYPYGTSRYEVAPFVAWILVGQPRPLYVYA